MLLVPSSWRSFYPVIVPFLLWEALLKCHTVIIKYLKPTAVQLPCTPDEPLQATVGLSPTRGARSLPDSVQTNTSEQRLPASRSPAFDLALARASAGMELIGFLSMTVASTGAFFTLASTVGSFGAGFSPAVQAVALDIYTNRSSQSRGEVGKLFGALSVIQALGYVFLFVSQANFKLVRECWLTM